jgi:hypothetical protein
MRWIKAAAAACLVGAGVLPVSMAAAGPAAAATSLPCSASVTVARPAHGQRTDVIVRTAARAWVGALAHYKTGVVKKTTHASSSGRAAIAFSAGKAVYGHKVVVKIYVDKGSRKGKCATSFTPTAPPKTYEISSCRASGMYSTCDEAGDATEPVAIQVHVTAKPNQSVLVSWDNVCSEGLNAASTSGQFTATTPVDRKIGMPYRHPDSCTVAAGAQLNNGGGSLHVWTVYEK